MSHALGEVYGRVLPFARAAPIAFAIPLVAEFAQHVVEIQGGMYGPVGLDDEAERLRLLFGAVKIVSIFVLVLFAVRYWSFDGDTRRAARPTAAMLKGLGIVMLVQIVGESTFMAIGAFASRMLGQDAAMAGRVAAMVLPILAWLFIATLLFPWFVGLLTEDRTMTLRRSVRAIRGRMWGTFGLLLGAFLPAMVVHYALGFGAMGRSGALLWVMMAIDAVVVAALATVLASAYFTIYRRAGARTERTEFTAEATA